MKSKILKVELLALFSLSLVNISYYYFRSSFPDNYLEISMSSESINWISYAFSSFFAFLSFYVGPWIFLSFLFFSLLYVTKLNTSQKWYSTVFIIPVLILCLIGGYLFAPELLGDGSFVVIKSYFDEFSLYVIFSVSVIALIGLSMTSSEKGLFSSGLSACRKTIRFFQFLGGKLKLLFGIRKKIKTPREISYNFKSNIVGLIKGDQDEGPDTVINEQKIDIVDSSVSSGEEEPLEFNFTEKNESPKERPSVGKTTRRTTHYEDAFSSKDLIKCVVSDERSSNPPSPDKGYFENIIQSIEEKMEELKIASRVVEIQKGPVVDTYELELGSGVRVSQVRNIADDLSLALYGAPVRITYPMAGKASMGVEVPRSPRETIFLDDVLSTKVFMETKHSLPIAMGKNAYGETVVVDLVRAPHMLVAGETGSGKSVFINTLLVSLLVKLSPTQLRLILIDPKTVELAPYSDLPHLALPIATEANMACVYLMWVVQEMEKRYKMLKAMGVRNLDGFNRKTKSASEEEMDRVYKFLDEEEERYVNDQMPFIVVVVDEFADLMTNKKYGKDIETNICRLAQKARACGIHLVLATQRPSVDVITGVIKSNFPTRVSFRVATSIDSKTILSHSGAEKLLGQGDMLYKQGIETSRLHSAFIHEEEVESLVEKLSELDVSYHQSALRFVEETEENEDPITGSFSTGSSADDLYEHAVQIAVENRAVSASMLQRRLHVGYNRAANLVEEMERNGVVGPQRGSKPREVLLSS